MNLIEKFQLDTHVYSNALQAKSRSVDMGLEGRIHVYDVNGQAYYMPGGTHKEYMDYMGEEAEDLTEMEVDDEKWKEALRIVVEELMKKDAVELFKYDEEERMVYGWASVVTEKGMPVVDRQGDVIQPNTLVKAVNKFMEFVRVGKEMHDGEQVGMVVHSWPVTNEICKAIGIQSDREGWIVAFKVYNDDVWAKVKSGELGAFSIGGRAIKEAYND